MNKDMERLLLDARPVFELLLKIGIAGRVECLQRHFSSEEFAAPIDTLLTRREGFDRQYVNPNVDAMWSGWCFALTSLDRIADAHHASDKSELAP
jgi:hypothetical protein